MKSYLIKVLEKGKDKNGEDVFVVLDNKLWELLNRPMVIMGGAEVTEIPKDCILCDGCNEPHPEYVMTDGDFLERTVCENCRQKYHKTMKVVLGGNSGYKCELCGRAHTGKKLLLDDLSVCETCYERAKEKSD